MHQPCIAYNDALDGALMNARTASAKARGCSIGQKWDPSFIWNCYISRLERERETERETERQTERQIGTETTPSLLTSARALGISCARCSQYDESKVFEELPPRMRVGVIILCTLSVASCGPSDARGKPL